MMFRMSRGKRVVPAMVLAASLTLLAACGSDTDKGEEKPGADGNTSEAPKEGRPLVVWAGSQTPIVANFNPYSPTVLHAALGSIYQSLFFYNKAAAGDPVPMLGESAEWAEDGKSLTIKIRPGVKWNDGTDFTVDDVIFSFTNDTAKADYVDSVEKIDDSTVKMNFNAVSFTNAYSILGATYMVPKHIFEKEADLVTFANATPVGTGPYKVQAVTDASYTIVANENYWEEGKPQVKEVQWIGVDANNSAESLFKAKQLDWATMFIAQPDTLTADGTLGYLAIHQNPTTLYTCSNAKLGCTGAQTDTAVRQALNLAIDRKTVNEKAFFNLSGDMSPTFAKPGRDDQWVAEGMPATSPQTADVAAATKILEDAGYTKGGDGIYEKDGKKVSMKLISVDGWSDYNAAAELIQAQAKEAGIEIKASTVTWDEFSDSRMTGNFELIVGGVVGTPIADPYQIYRDWFSGDYTQKVGTQLESGEWNMARYDNPVVNEAVKKAATTNDEATKKEAYAAIQKEIVNDLPYIPMFLSASQTFYNQVDFDGWPTQDNLYSFPPAWDGMSSGVVLANLTYK
ncbi:ABC transporter substrate-binding protein [Timonella senegalensis]|uniref:ABC transporter substrate-binding protein n=1 Tax=Timonella senegalensis TaxID=1465825 RepID=UPI002FDDEDAB